MEAKYLAIDKAKEILEANNYCCAQVDEDLGQENEYGILVLLDDLDCMKELVQLTKLHLAYSWTIFASDIAEAYAVDIQFLVKMFNEE